jgi:hypothetical protein
VGHYRARDARLGRDVSLKILPPEVANDPIRRQRIELEARAVAALNHPNMVSTYDVGPGYIVSELVDGEPLRGGKLGLRKEDRHHRADRQRTRSPKRSHRTPIASPASNAKAQLTGCAVLIWNRFFGSLLSTTRKLDRWLHGTRPHPREDTLRGSPEPILYKIGAGPLEEKPTASIDKNGDSGRY